MEIVNGEIEKYIAGLRGEAKPVRAEMEQRAAKNGFPIIGPEVGRFLAILARAAGAKRVLELGSGFGYSAYWIASAIAEDGVIICTDNYPKNKDRALDYLGRAGLVHKIRFELGDALEIIDRLEGPFDLIFNDVDKEEYPDTIDKVAPKLAPGGLFITDNALWYGKVTQPGEREAATAGVDKFNRRLIADPRFETVILPIRDGLAVAVKKG